MRLGIITPFKNESNTIEVFLKSVLKQVNCDYHWLLINDSSDDGGEKIAGKLIEGSDNISLINKTSSLGKRKTGSNVVHIINEGIEYFKSIDYRWEVLLKIDADIDLVDINHFEFILDKFKKNKVLGIASGNVFHFTESGVKVYESKYRWKTQGQAKFYRRECFEEMGGLKPFKGWDGIDDVLAREKGFITQKFYELEVHHKYETQTRSAEGGIFAGVKREVMGYRNRAYPLFFYFGKTVKLITKKPLLIRAFFFFLYSIYANVFIRHKLSQKEVKIVRNHIKHQLKDDFEYID